MDPQLARDGRSTKTRLQALAGALCPAVIGIVLLSPLASAESTAAIYRCLDKNLTVLYTDEPCKDGEAMNIRAGDADPAALARLDRERDALNQSAAQRIADERRNAAQRDLAAMYARPAANSVDDYQPTEVSYADGVYWYPPFVPDHRPRPRPPKPMAPPRFAPQPHEIVFPR